MFSLPVGFVFVLYVIDTGDIFGLVFLFLTPFVLGFLLFALWGIYIACMRLAREGGSRVDAGFWAIMALLIFGVTLWSRTIIDLNRWIIVKLFYRGEAPVEYTWIPSK